MSQISVYHSQYITMEPMYDLLSIPNARGLLIKFLTTFLASYESHWLRLDPLQVEVLLRNVFSAADNGSMSIKPTTNCLGGGKFSSLTSLEADKGRAICATCATFACWTALTCCWISSGRSISKTYLILSSRTSYIYVSVVEIKFNAKKVRTSYQQCPMQKSSHFLGGFHVESGTTGTYQYVFRSHLAHCFIFGAKKHAAERPC